MHLDVVAPHPLVQFTQRQRRCLVIEHGERRRLHARHRHAVLARGELPCVNMWRGISGGRVDDDGNDGAGQEQDDGG